MSKLYICTYQENDPEPFAVLATNEHEAASLIKKHLEEAHGGHCTDLEQRDGHFVLTWSDCPDYWSDCPDYDHFPDWQEEIFKVYAVPQIEVRGLYKYPEQAIGQAVVAA